MLIVLYLSTLKLTNLPRTLLNFKSSRKQGLNLRSRISFMQNSRTTWQIHVVIGMFLGLDMHRIKWSIW